MVEKGLLAFRVSNYDLAEACNATVPMDGRTIADILETKLIAPHFLAE